MQSGQIVASFPIMNKMSETNDNNSITQSEAVKHLNRLIKEFRRYFLDVEYGTPVMTLTRNPFRLSVEDFPEDLNETIQEEFLDMIHDSSAKASFEDESLEDF